MHYTTSYIPSSIELPFGGADSVLPPNHVIDGDKDPPKEGVIFERMQSNF